MPLLITSDTHFVDTPSEAYRLDLLPWLRLKAKRYNADALFILGDLAHKKDNHPARLVNQIVDGLERITRICPTYILRANHDYTDPKWPFFRFLGKVPNLTYINKPKSLTLRVDGEDLSILFLPHTRDPVTDWQSIDLSKSDLICMHQTIEGSRASNGVAMEGLSVAYLKNKGVRKGVSGDIHVPQKIGPITYCSSPYRINFGDKFEPRVLLVDGNLGFKNLRYPCIKKHLIEINEPDQLEDYTNIVAPEDRIKVRLYLKRADLVIWNQYRQKVKEYCKEHDWDVHSIELKPMASPTRNTEAAAKVKTKEEIFNEFCTTNKLPKSKVRIGKELL